MARRRRNLVLFALLSAAGAYLALIIGAAWLYVGALTAPGCNRSPAPLPGAPAPREVTLHTADGLALRGWYYPGAQHAAVMVMGGLGGALGDTLPPAGFLVRDGFAVLQVDSRACAEPRAAVTLGADEALDAEAGLAFLQGQPGIEHIGIIGFSMGGVTAIRAAARNPGIEAVVAEGGYHNMGADMTNAGERMSPLRRLFLYTVAGVSWLRTGSNPFSISPVDEIARISPRPVLLIYGSKEIGKGRGDLQYAAAGEPKELWVVPGGWHGGNYTVAREEYERRVLQFFHSTLMKK